MQVRNIPLPEKINGHRRGVNGVYVPGKEMIGKILDAHKPARRKYLEQSGELQRMMIAKKLERPIMLAGPTGSGKSILAQEFAGSLSMPFVHVTMTEDTTDAKLRGYLSQLTFPMEFEKSIFNAEVMAFVPSPFSIAVMSGQPTVLFLDELHKIRKGVTSILHPLANKGERRLPMIEFTGEVYPLHKESVVICALNPDAEYGDGFSELDPALRRRFTTINLELPGNKKLFTKIVDINLGVLEGEPPENFEKTKSVLVEAVLALNQSMVNYRIAEETGNDAGTILDNAIEGDEIAEIKERVSVDSVIAALEFIWMGIDAKIAVTENIVHSVVERFGSAVTALENYFEAKGVW
jgi:MoxR-like ATPase